MSSTYTTAFPRNKHTEAAIRRGDVPTLKTELGEERVEDWLLNIKNMRISTGAAGNTPSNPIDIDNAFATDLANAITASSTKNHATLPTPPEEERPDYCGGLDECEEARQEARRCGCGMPGPILGRKCWGDDDCVKKRSAGKHCKHERKYICFHCGAKGHKASTCHRGRPALKSTRRRLHKMQAHNDHLNWLRMQEQSLSFNLEKDDARREYFRQAIAYEEEFNY
jgi:hypothetical protein